MKLVFACLNILTKKNVQIITYDALNSKAIIINKSLRYVCFKKKEMMHSVDMINH